MSLFIQLIIGASMIGVTVVIHAVVLDFIIRNADSLEKPLRRLSRRLWKAFMVSAVVMGVFMAHVVIIWLWALLYLGLDCQPLVDFEEALYFATVVYSTLGFGDIILDDSCKMLSGIEGANGFILFGWTAAFIFEIVGQIYRKEARSL